MRRLGDESGTAIVLTIMLLTVLIGVAALVIDVGSWFAAQRRLQGAADAATLAAAQDLPDTTAASSDATAYANANVAALNAWTATFPDANTIDVRLSKPAPGFFAKVFDVFSVTVHAHARASIGVPSRLPNVAPVAVKNTSACTTAALSCFGTTKSLNFDESNLTSSRFGLISLSCEGATATSCSSSATGSSDLVGWIQSGYPGYLDTGKWYSAVTGEKIGPVRDSLASAGTARKVLLFPVFDTADATGKAFHIVGWAAFVIDAGGVVSWKNDAPSCRPNCKVLQGHFTEYVAHGVDGGSSGATNYGVRTVSLVQ